MSTGAYWVQLLFQIPTMLPSLSLLVSISYPQKATSNRNIFEQLQIQKPKYVYSTEIYHSLFPTVLVHPVRQKNLRHFLAFINTQGGASFFPIFVKVLCTYFRKADAERCFYIIHIIIRSPRALGDLKISKRVSK